jgi:hypothetical protein
MAVFLKKIGNNSTEMRQMPLDTATIGTRKRNNASSKKSEADRKLHLIIKTNYIKT